MPDFRVYVSPSPTLTARELVLSAGEGHHLVQVNRARCGDPVIAFDGEGREWSCILESGDGRKPVHLRVVSHFSRTPLPCSLVLGQALAKGGTMDEIMRQATELGAAVIAPLSTSRSEVHLDPERAAKKVDKWRVATIEAAKQCGNPWVPRVEPIQPISAFLTSPAVQATELRLVASLRPEAQPLHDILAKHRATHGRGPASVAWLVGPEGDFSPEESAYALAAGWLPASLGPLVLRCDTAAVYALATLRCATERD